MTAREQPPAGKATLHPKNGYREPPEMAAATRRFIRTVGEKIAEDDPEKLSLLLELEDELRRAWENAITGIRRSGFTDREIGEALGTTRQAVEQRWPRKART